MGDDGRSVRAVKTVNIAVGADGRFEELPGTEKEWPADLIILAMGFRHPEHVLTSTLDVEVRPGRGRDRARGTRRPRARVPESPPPSSLPTPTAGLFLAGRCLRLWPRPEARRVRSQLSPPPVSRCYPARARSSTRARMRGRPQRITGPTRTASSRRAIAGAASRSSYGPFTRGGAPPPRPMPT